MVLIQQCSFLVPIPILEIVLHFSYTSELAETVYCALNTRFPFNENDSHFGEIEVNQNTKTCVSVTRFISNENSRITVSDDESPQCLGHKLRKVSRV